MARHNRSIAPSSIVRVVRYWRLFDSSERALNCELCRTDVGLEVRCGTDTGRPVRTARVEHAKLALVLAEQWRAEFLDEDTGYHQASNDDTSFDVRTRTVLEQRSRRARHLRAL